MTVLAAEAIKVPPADYSAILPELVLIGTGLLVLLLIALRRAKTTTPYVLVSIAGVLGSAAASCALWSQVSSGKTGPGKVRYAFSGMVAADGFSTFLVFLVCVATVMGILIADNYLRREGLAKAEYYILILLSASGMQLMAVSNNLVMVFLSIEIVSVCLYVLSAFRRDERRSQEAGAKYLLLGAFSSAIMLYGIALVYGGTGTLNLSALARYLGGTILTKQGFLLVGLALVIVGLAFKVAAVPFHMWTPDVYQGAPTPVVAFMAAGAKIAGFAGIIRVLQAGFASYALDWQPVLWGLAVLTMFVGAVLAIVQSDVKRMLAYSSISHAGFILVGVTAGNAKGIQGALFYLAAYTFVILGSFAVVGVIASRGEQYTSLDDYKGLFRREPVLAAVLTFLLFAQAGIPGTSGFVAKFAVFAGAAADQQWALIVLATLASVVSAYAYVRLVVYMYAYPLGAETPTERLRVPAGTVVALVAAVLFTFELGVLPETLLDVASRAKMIFG